MLKIGNKVYRNLQEQVEKNKDDIEDIKKSLPYPSEEYYNKDEVDAMKVHLHKIALIWDDGGEEPSYKKAFLEIFSTNSEEYTLETLLQYIGNATMQFNVSIQYEYGTNYIPAAATVTTNLSLYKNISDSLSVSGYYWTSEDDFYESHGISFTPTSIEDIIE